MQLSGAGDLPLGKNADEVTVHHGGFGFLQRADQRFGAFSGLDGDDPHDLAQRLQNWHAREVGINDEAGDAGEGSHHQHSIDERHVVDNDQSAAAFWDIVTPVDMQSIERVRHQIHEEAECQVRDQPQDIDEDGNRPESGHRIDGSGREMQDFSQNEKDPQRQQDEQERNEVTSGEDHATLSWIAAILQVSFQRDVEHPRPRS